MSAGSVRRSRLSLASVAILTIGVSTGQTAGWAAFPRRLIGEPIFGLSFAPDKARFDTVRLADTPEPCRASLLSEYIPQARLLVYADRTESDTRILVLGDRSGGDLLLIRSGTCKKDAVLPALLQNHPVPSAGGGDAPLVSPAELHQVFADILARYARAFGGKQRFLSWLDTLTSALRAGCEGKPGTGCPPSYRMLPSDLQAMLQAFRQN